jgi:hypothetical protein
MNLKEIRRRSVELIHLVQDRDKYKAHVKKAMNI